MTRSSQSCEASSKAQSLAGFPSSVEDQELTQPRLDEIKKAVATRRQIIEVLPHGTARDDALEALDKADEIVREMDTELSGVGAFSGTSA